MAKSNESSVYEQLNKLQQGLKIQIEKSHSNFKKSPKERLTWSYIDMKITLLDQLWEKFQNNHMKMIETSQCGDEDIFDIYSEGEDEYISAKETMLRKQSEIPRPVTSNKDSEISSQQIKLPAIQIPTFDGNYSEWIPFYDQFVSLIHYNKTLSKVNKLHLLKQNLKGEAASLLKHIPVTESNYESAWLKLKDRYSNKRVIINSYLQRLMSLKTITNENSVFIKNLLDSTTECLSGLNGIGVNTESWDPIIIYLLTSKLDTETLRGWEQEISKYESERLPTFEELTKYLESRFRSLERIQSTKGNLRTLAKPTITDKRVFYNAPKEGCILCGEDHYIYKCQDFVKYPLQEKKSFIEKNHLCFNCLIPNHGVKQCKQKARCRICGKRHHTLIHTEYRNVKTPENYERQDNSTLEHIQPTKSRENENIATHYAMESRVQHTTNILLATALVKVTAENGRRLQLRALIDQGSEGSFITERATQALGLKKQTINGTISGLGNNIVMHTRHIVSLNLQSEHDKMFNLPVKAYVLKTLTRLLPSTQIDMRWKHLQGLQLADPNYGTPASVDLLLGAEVYSNIILEGVQLGSSHTPLAQNTRLGWILSGEVKSINNSTHNVINMHLSTQPEDNDNLQRFWELESGDTYKLKKQLTEEEERCEKNYKETYTRDSDGRYIVEIPLKQKNLDYGNTKQIARRRLEYLEKRLDKDEELKTEYTKVLMEYIQLNHMEEITNHENETTQNSFYMPHHAVIRPDKSTSKVRIVFDASCKGPNGKSLNDNMLIGPKLQQDLRQLVMRWRRSEIAFIADCVKMYRQIKVTNESADYQRILWRVNGEVREFRLTRVTFGTASAPFLATKTLQQLAIDEEKSFPIASKVAKEDFYMDDLLSGADNLKDAIEVHTQMTNLMKAGGFELQKWASNNLEFEKHVENGEPKADDTYILKTETIIKTLGIKWNKNSDRFQYDINLRPVTKPVTKRFILGEISRLFDPMGWLAPVIVVAKIIIQNLWLARVGWDEEVPRDVETEWFNFCNDLKQAENIYIERWLNTNNNDKKVELHGYSDASQKAYAAAVYLRVVKVDGTITVRLVTAKTRVAPIKTVSIPRLELCGAVLLTKLLYKVAECLSVSHADIHAYTDSTIVLAWLQCHPSRWKTFIANRTSEILTILPANCWNYVESAQNPADVASRGASPSQLLQSDLWWTGPEDLLKENITYKQLQENTTDLEKKKEKVNVFNNIVTETEQFDLLKRYSNITKLLRVTAYILRIFTKQKSSEIHLTGLEIDKAREVCIKLCQKEAFEDEIERIKTNKNLRKDSKLRSLNAFIDEKGIIRVGGRLEKSNLPDFTKHQIILPGNHAFTKLILTDYHIRTLHGGPTMLLSNLRRRYWIVHAKSLVRKVVHQCIKCARFRANTRNQMMGSLPDARVTPCKPFLHSGVDFAGPIDLRLSKGRGCKTQKGYIAIFICMVTKAIHIEIVTSLNTQDFIAAFKRFVARRGHCSDMWSDNGTNLTAGNKELKSLFDKSTENIQQEIENTLANDGTTWHHIPPSAPHFGGLWEAGVKSIKFHLRRILGNSTLTYEEMSTVTSQIEACLNSRPISPMSDDPTDFLPLTPAHFLLGEPQTLVPEESYLNSSINHLSRWQLTQRMFQDFWRRWSSEYLSRLQQRPKWMTKQQNFKTGDLVLLKDENLPPSKWSLGRVIEIHPGKDNLVRVISVKCKNSIIKRPITKVCFLPN